MITHQLRSDIVSNIFNEFNSALTCISSTEIIMYIETIDFLTSFNRVLLLSLLMHIQTSCMYHLKFIVQISQVLQSLIMAKKFLIVIWDSISMETVCLESVSNLKIEANFDYENDYCNAILSINLSFIKGLNN